MVLDACWTCRGGHFFRCVDVEWLWWTPEAGAMLYVTCLLVEILSKMK